MTAAKGGHARSAARAVASVVADLVPALDEEEASADDQSGHASLLHPWQGSCDARTIEFRATRQRLCRGIVSDPSRLSHKSHGRIVGPFRGE